ncbi:MAG: NUDIX domain-containing protein [Myxococcales bacterium]|nr:NUDIX domain-containing protein [Myxococcales bacterium]
MPERSAALAVVRRGRSGSPEVLIVHPGGPFFAKKDAGAWSLPKGLLEPGEGALTAARREFQEETGSAAPDGPATPLGEVVLKSGKHVIGFGVVGDFEVTALKSNEVELKLRGRLVRFPEVDRAEWATLERARVAVNPAQLPLIEKALTLVR